LVVTSDQILFFLSGGVANSNPLESKGGAISNTVILPDAFNTVFDDITAVENSEGTLENRALYVKNVGADMLRAPRIYFGFADNFVTVGLTSRTAGMTEDSIPTEDSTPGAGSDGTGGTPVVDPTEWSIMYQHPETMPNVFSLNDVAKRVGMHNFGVRSAAYNRRQDRFDVWLHKAGSPSGPITATVRNIKKGVDNIVASYNTTYEASTLSTTPTRKSFIMSPDRKYTPDVDDVTSIEYANGTSANNVRLSVVNHPNTPALQEWSVAWYSNKWQALVTPSIMQAEIFTSTCGMASPGGGGSEQPEVPEAPPITFTGFTRPTRYEDGLLLGDIPPGSYRGFWLQRLMKPNQRPSDNVVFQLLVKGGNA
jgi:hypothetical protein